MCVLMKLADKLAVHFMKFIQLLRLEQEAKRHFIPLHLCHLIHDKGPVVVWNEGWNLETILALNRSGQAKADEEATDFLVGELRIIAHGQMVEARPSYKACAC